MPSSVRNANRLLVDDLRRSTLLYADLCVPPPKKLDEGNFGITYLADLRSHENSPLKVVCKVSKKRVGKSEWEEFKNLNNLKPHPHVVRLLGICTDWEGDGIAMVFEYHMGGSLQAYIRKNADLPVDRLVPMAFVMASAVAHLHKHSVLHRDIALRNFVVSNESLPVLVDFGMARKQLEYGCAASQARLPWRWTPLEMLQSQDTVVSTTSSDVYSLGIAFWELFHKAQRPFNHVANSSALRNLLTSTQNGDSPLEFRRELTCSSSALVDLIKRMCHSDVEQRPSAAEVCRTLFGLLHSSFRLRCEKLLTDLADSVDCLPNQGAPTSLMSTSLERSELYNDEQKILEVEPYDRALCTRDKMDLEPSRSVRTQELFDDMQHDGFSQHELGYVVKTLRSAKLDVRILRYMERDRFDDAVRSIFPSEPGIWERMRWHFNGQTESQASRAAISRILGGVFMKRRSRGNSLTFFTLSNMHIESDLREAVSNNDVFLTSRILQTYHDQVKLHEVSNWLHTVEEFWFDDFLVDNDCYNNNKYGITGGTLMHIAVLDGSADMVSCLLHHASRQAKTLLNATTDSGVSPLYLACVLGDADIVQVLLSSKCLSLQNEIRHRIRRRNFLGAAVYHNHDDIVRLILANSHIPRNAKSRFQISTSVDVRKPDEYLTSLDMDVRHFLAKSVKDALGVTALHHASSCGLLDIVKHLTSIGEDDVNVPDSLKGTPLHIAAEFAHVELVKHLTSIEKVNVNARDFIGSTPLHRAAELGHVELVKHFTSIEKVDISARDRIGRTPLHCAAISGTLEVVKHLTSFENVDVNARNRFGGTPLHCAAELDKLEVVTHLTSIEKVDVNARDRFGETPLHNAARRGKFEVVKLLTSHDRFGTDTQDNWKSNSLDDDVCDFAPCKNKKHSNTSYGVGVDARNTCGETPLHIAASWCESYCDSEDGVSEPSSDDDRALQSTTQNEHFERHECLSTKKSERTRDDELLKCESTDGVIDNNNYCGHFEVVKYLTSIRRVDVNTRDFHGNTPLHSAAWGRNVAIVDHLLSIGNADLNTIECNGNTLLHLAALNANVSFVEYLLSTGKIDANARNGEGDTPLLCAVQPWFGNKPRNGEHLRVLRCFISEKQIEFDATTSQGDTALHRMARIVTSERGERDFYERAVKLLLACGRIDVHATNDDGKTALDLARENTGSAVLEALVAAEIKLVQSKRSIGGADLNSSSPKGTKDENEDKYEGHEEHEEKEEEKESSQT